MTLKIITGAQPFRTKAFIKNGFLDMDQLLVMVGLSAFWQNHFSKPAEQLHDLNPCDETFLNERAPQ